MSTAAGRAIAALAAFAGAPERVWAAPGRVNLIGEHVDYHDGLVCPIAIDRHTVVAVRGRNDRVVRIVSAEREGTASFDLDRPGHPTGRWTDYVEGTARELEADGFVLRGASLAVASDVPIGAGLSSSAALEIAAGAALVDLSGHEVDRRRLAAAGRHAENRFVGVRTGVMDQLAVALGVRDHALEIDCRTEGVVLVPVPEQAAFVVADSGVRHALVTSGYNDRRTQSEAAAERLGVSLRDADVASIERAGLPETLHRRARHVVTEIARVRAFERALRAGDLLAAGYEMTASHASLRDDYEASVPEVDALVERALAVPGVFGARMTGGGFGGSVLASTTRDRANDVARSLTGQATATIVVRASDGACPLTY